MLPENLDQILQACSLRKPLVVKNPESAYRLFSGFREGDPSLVIDRYHKTLVIFDHSPKGAVESQTMDALTDGINAIYPDIDSILLKSRNAAQPELRRGIFLRGKESDRWIREAGIRYAIDLQMNQDASFYLDTRELRAWLMMNSSGKVVLNTFAYTGSLGVAAVAGNAAQVIQTDLNRTFLDLAKTSYSLNGYPIDKSTFIAGDFFKVVTQLKKSGKLFDTVILDPPFFSDTDAGRVDIVNEYARLINKVRPLVANNGRLIAINNAVFLSGSEYLQILDTLCKSDYLSLEEIIPVPEDSAGFPQSITAPPLVDPAPFNHSTKIAVLHVTRKDGQSACLTRKN